LLSTLARWVYSFWAVLSVPARLARLWWRGRSEPRYRLCWAERFAFGAPKCPAGAVWVHVQSAAELRAAASLIDKLRDLDPRWRFLLTHADVAGRVGGLALAKAGDVQAWLPFDTPGAARRFFKRHRPRLGVLIGRAAGPNLLHAASRAGVPLYLANARLSQADLRAVGRRRALTIPALQSLKGVLAQSDADATRLAQAGAQQVRVVGNLDFDVLPPVRLIARGHEWRRAIGRPVVLAAGLHAGEEQPLLQAWKAVRSPRPLAMPLLAIVPRSPSQLAAIELAVRTSGLRLARRSAWGQAATPAACDADVLLGDSVGEMAAYYGLADVALLGGSFAPQGGAQSPVEAAICGCPVLMGPNTCAQANAVDLVVAAGAAESTAGMAQAVARATQLAGDARRNTMVRNVFAFVAAHHGAVQRVVASLMAQMSRQIQPKSLGAPAVRLRLGR